MLWHKHGLSYLNELADVDLTTAKPADGDVLTFMNNEWVTAAPSGNIEDCCLVLEDLTPGEPVILIDDTPPENVSSISITSLNQTNLTIWWTESPSPDVKDYNLYANGTLMATVPATTAKLEPLSSNVAGLTPGTDYTIVIKAQDESNNEANGASVDVRTYGTYAFAMSGTGGDSVTIPSLTLDKLEIELYVDPNQPGTYADIYRSTGGLGHETWLGPHSDTRMTYVKEVSSPVTVDYIYILSGNANGTYHATKGLLYRVNCYLSGHLIKMYDFSTRDTGDAIIHGGSWVHWSESNGGALE